MPNNSKKSPYPTFSPVSTLFDRCIEDIKQFRKLETPNNSSLVPDITFNVEGKPLRVIKEMLQLKVLNPMNKLLNDPNSYIDSNSYTHFNGASRTYVAVVPFLKKEVQKMVWQYRTYLFYQILIIEAYAFSNIQYGKFNSYKDIFDDYFKKTELTQYSNIETISNLVLADGAVTFGIFGSLTPTSDIDVGVNYFGPDAGPELNSVLSYIMVCSESLFYILTGMSSLAFDIEFYANLISLPNKDSATKEKHPDYFYLDSNVLEKEDYKSFLKYAGASMMRNVLMHSYDAFNSNNNSKKASIETAKRSVSKVLTPEFLNYFGMDDTQWLEDGVIMAQQYLQTVTSDQIRADKEYYRLLSIAEKERNSIIAKYTNQSTKTNNSTNTNIILSKEDVIKIMGLLAETGLWRRENYMIVSSIFHVVYTIQGAGPKAEKYKTQTPVEFCDNVIKPIDAFCNIGLYGYLFSILEQLGFIIRFYNTYCTNQEGHKDPAKCNKKYGKYIIRVEDAVKRIHNMNKSYNGDIVLSTINNLKNMANAVNQNATNQKTTNQKTTNQNTTNLKSAMNALAKASNVLKRRSNKLNIAHVPMRQVAPSVAGGRRTHKKRAHKKRTRRNKF